MRRVLIVGIIILCAFVCGGCASRAKLNNVFNTYNRETDEQVPYVRFNTLVFDDETTNMEEILLENGYDGIFHEVYVIQKRTIWFGFTDLKKSKENRENWNIASINIDEKKIRVYYSGDFCFDKKADETYITNHRFSKDRYLTTNGYYYEGTIVLTDHVKTVEFNLKTNSSTEFLYKNYKYPEMNISTKITEHRYITFSDGSEQKIFNVERGIQSSKVFEQLYEFDKKKNWQGKSYLSELFDNIQMINNQFYIICKVSNWDGEVHAIVFQYDFEDNVCKYAFHCFMDDVINDNLYVVPMI